MAELEARLRALGDELAWPETPDLSGAVLTALRDRRAEAETSSSGAPAGAARPVRRRIRRPRRLAALVAAALLLIPAAGAAAFPEARNDVLEWLGLRKTEVRRVPATPAARPPASPDLGERVSLAEAARRARFAPLVPAGLGPPAAVFVDEFGATMRITLVYRPRRGLPALRSDGVRAGLLITETRGRLEGDLLRKIVGVGTGVESVRVNGDPGVLFTGEEHVYLYLDPAGQVQEDRPWLAGDTLVLERDGAVVRLEAAGGPAALRRLAASLRVSPARAP